MIKINGHGRSGGVMLQWEKRSMEGLMLGVVAFTAVALSGCAATGTLISKRDLDVQTKMSESIILDPVAPAKQVVFVQIRNTSDKPDFSIQHEIEAAIAAKGWTVTRDPDKAQFMLQGNILQVGKADPTAAEAFMGGGYGTPLGGAVLGAGVAGASGSGFQGAATGGLIGGVADFIGGALVKDVFFSVITDIQIAQRTAKPIRMTGEQKLTQGTQGTERLDYAEDTNWKKYRTRVMSSANKANLEWTEAQPELVRGLTQSISGLF